LVTMCRETREELMTPEMLAKFRGLLAVFALGALYFTIAADVTKFYQTAHRGVVLFLLRDGGVYPLVFWLGQILIGTVLPLAIVAFGKRWGLPSRPSLIAASTLFLIGGLCQMYVLIIGGQAYPLDIFPGYQASSVYADGQVGTYAPSLPEVLLGLSGISVAMLLTAVAFRLFPFLPKGVRPAAPAESGA